VRVVFDTNVLVSALVTPGGRGEAAVLRVVEGTDQLIISREIVLELLDVLSRKLSHDRDQLARVAMFLDELGETVKPERSIEVLADEPDNRILECAVAGNADAIVTGDKVLQKLGDFEGISILPLGEYMDSN
jgi:putative PIN family toxin of toxin-antitoxin system